MKEILQNLMTTDIGKIHDWINYFETNVFLKKHKIYRKMNEKLNFYSKLQIPVLQDAVNRLSNSIQTQDKIASFGEFSILNMSHKPFNSGSLLSNNKSKNSHQSNTLINLENEENSGFLDNLKLEFIPHSSSQSLCVQSKNIVDLLNRTWLIDLPIDSIGEYLQNMNQAMG